MKKNTTCFLLVLIICVLLAIPHASLAQGSENSSFDQASFSSYGSYAEAREQEFIPTKIAPLKAITFPLMFIAAPIVFPGYYVYTEEPDFKQSMKNYWDWIYFMVPHDVDAIEHKEVTFPKDFPDRETDKPYSEKIDMRESSYLDSVPPSIEKEAKEAKKDGKSFFGMFKKKEKEEREKVPAKETKTDLKALAKQKKKEQEKQNTIEKLLSEGDNYLGRNNFDKALVAYSHVQKLDGSNTNAASKIKTIEMKKSIAAETKKKRIEMKQKAAAAEREAEKNERIRKKQLKKEEKINRQVAKYLKKADGYYEKKKIKKAITYYEKTLAVQPENAHARSRKEQLSALLEAEARAGRDKIKGKEKKKEVTTLLQSADEQFEAKNYSEASNLYNEVLRRDATNEHAHERLIAMKRLVEIDELNRTAQGLHQSEKYDEAAVVYKKALGDIASSSSEPLNCNCCAA